MKLDNCRAAAAYAAFQIEGLTPEQMKVLRAELNLRGENSSASEAARFLAEIGPPAAAATPDLAAALTYEDRISATTYQLPSAAAQALGKIRSQPAVAVPA